MVSVYRIVLCEETHTNVLKISLNILKKYSTYRLSEIMVARVDICLCAAGSSPKEMVLAIHFTLFYFIVFSTPPLSKGLCKTVDCCLVLIGSKLKSWKSGRVKMGQR